MATTAGIREAQLVATRDLSPEVRVLTLAVLDASPFTWWAGQHVELLVDTGNGAIERQPFSIASVPDPEAPGRFEIAVAREDASPRTRAVRALQLGDRVRVRGPKGEMTRRHCADRPAVMVATGTGVAPVRAMVHEELQRADGPTLVLLFGCRLADDILWNDELSELARRHPRFRFEPTLSQPPVGWTGRAGYVQQHLRPVLEPLGAVPVFLCGQPGMVAEAKRVLEDELAHPAELVFTERQ